MKDDNQVEYCSYLCRPIFLHPCKAYFSSFLVNMTPFFRTYIILPILLVLSSEAFAIGDVETPTIVLPDFWNKGPGDVIALVISFAISMVAILAVIAITWGSIQMILASGEEEKIKKSRMIIIYAFVGLLVAGLAYGTVKVVTGLQF